MGGDSSRAVEPRTPFFLSHLRPAGTSESLPFSVARGGSPSLLEQRGHCLSDLRVHPLLGDQTSKPRQAVAGRPSRLSCFPVEIVTI